MDEAEKKKIIKVVTSGSAIHSLVLNTVVPCIIVGGKRTGNTCGDPAGNGVAIPDP